MNNQCGLPNFYEKDSRVRLSLQRQACNQVKASNIKDLLQPRAGLRKALTVDHMARAARNRRLPWAQPVA